MLCNMGVVSIAKNSSPLNLWYGQDNSIQHGSEGCRLQRTEELRHESGRYDIKYSDQARLTFETVTGNSTLCGALFDIFLKLLNQESIILSFQEERRHNWVSRFSLNGRGF